MAKYFSGFKKDWNELSSKHTSGGEKALAGVRILGKSVASVGTFAFTEFLPGMIKNAGETAEKNLAENRSKMTEEQIAKAEKIVKNSKVVGQRQEKIRRIEQEIEYKNREIQQMIERGYENSSRVAHLETEILELEAQKPRLFEKPEE